MKTTVIKFIGTEQDLKLELTTLQGAGIGILEVKAMGNGNYELIAPVQEDDEFWNEEKKVEIKKVLTYSIEGDGSIDTNNEELKQLMNSKVNMMSGQDYLSYGCKWYNKEFGILELQLSFYSRSVKFYYDTVNNCKADMRTKAYNKIKRVG